MIESCLLNCAAKHLVDLLSEPVTPLFSVPKGNL